MQQLDDDDRKQALGEVILDELKIIREYLESLLPLTKDVTELKQDVAELKSDMKVVKAAVTDQGRQVQDHEIRITRLEVAN